MEKSVVGSLVFVSMIFLCFTFIPNVLSQPENVEVLNYSWYPSQGGYLVVVGEVQNVGPNIIENITAEFRGLETRSFSKYSAAKCKTFIYLHSLTSRSLQ